LVNEEALVEEALPLGTTDQVVLEQHQIDLFSLVPKELISAFLEDLSFIDVLALMTCNRDLFDICSAQLHYMSVSRDCPMNTLSRFPNVEAICLRGVRPYNSEFLLSFPNLRWLSVFELDGLERIKFPKNLKTLEVFDCVIDHLGWVPPTTEHLLLERTTVLSSLTDDKDYGGPLEPGMTSQELSKQFENLTHLELSHFKASHFVIHALLVGASKKLKKLVRTGNETVFWTTELIEDINKSEINELQVSDFDGDCLSRLELSALISLNVERSLDLHRGFKKLESLRLQSLEVRSAIWKGSLPDFLRGNKQTSISFGHVNREESALVDVDRFQQEWLPEEEDDDEEEDGLCILDTEDPNILLENFTAESSSPDYPYYYYDFDL